MTCEEKANIFYSLCKFGQFKPVSLQTELKCEFGNHTIRLLEYSLSVKNETHPLPGGWFLSRVLEN